MKKYFSLLQRIDGRWTIQFGDYVKSVVNQEKIDMIDSDDSLKSRDFTIITTSDDQASINAAVEALNAAQHDQHVQDGEAYLATKFSELGMKVLKAGRNAS